MLGSEADVRNQIAFGAGCKSMDDVLTLLYDQLEHWHDWELRGAVYPTLMAWLAAVVQGRSVPTVRAVSSNRPTLWLT